MKIQFLCDNIHSWVVPFIEDLLPELKNHDATLIHAAYEVREGDILFLLSCEGIFKNLHLNKHNLVIHGSALPKGKGWSPMTWLILEGATDLPMTLFEAQMKVDSGPIYAQKWIKLNGTELLPDLHDLQKNAMKELIMDFINVYPDVHGTPQQGEESYYDRRKLEDSEIDTTKSIDEVFNLLRVCDNERYPAFFRKNGQRYILKIYKG